VKNDISKTTEEDNSIDSLIELFAEIIAKQIIRNIKNRT
jgi:hypothetical protein